MRIAHSEPRAKLKGGAVLGEPTTYRMVKWGVDRLPPFFCLARHPHSIGYATVILAGNFIESSFAGLFRVEPGDVLLHAGFDCHNNCDGSSRGMEILRLPWRMDGIEGRFRCSDPDGIVRLCEQDPFSATERLATELMTPSASNRDWPENLASAMLENSSLAIGQWAAENDISAEAVSRGFHQTFGTTPRRYRLELRARRAWRAVLGGKRSLTDIAHEYDFSDLAHLSRSIRSLTGQPPSAWRKRALEAGSGLS